MYDDWAVVLDVTDNFESKISSLAIADAERTYNSIYKYIKASFLRSIQLSVNQI